VALEPRLLSRGSQSYAGVRDRLLRGELVDAAPRLLSEVFAFLRGHQIPTSGAPLIRYLVVDYNTGEVEIDVGVPVHIAALPADHRVRLRQIPAGLFATVVHSGSYSTLMETTAKLLDWAKKNNVRWQVRDDHNVTQWGGRIEHYLVGPPTESNANNWRTEIAILLSADSQPYHRGPL